MSQSRKQSALESSINVSLGLVISWTFTLFVFQTTPMFAAKITLSYAALSWVRGYAVRRVFNRLHSHGSLSTPTSARPSWFPPEMASPSTFQNPASNWRR